MGVNREEVKRMIDQIPDQDAVEVRDFIGSLQRERQVAQEDQIGDEYTQASGHNYFRAKVEEYRHGQIL